MTRSNAIRRPVPEGELPDFTPVPRKQPRHDGWTPERQRAFVAALADTGCVSIACRMVNMSQRSYYMLRRQPGAESFRAAADAAQSFGLHVVKDEAFDRAMNGQLVPVFVAGRLMGFRRKKNDRLLMFILRHYGQDSAGRKTTINYFSTRATAAAGAAAPSGRPELRSSARTSARDAGFGRPTTGEAVSIDVTNSVRDGGSALAAAEAFTTTVKTIISGNPVQSTTLDREADLLNAFSGVELDEEAQAEIYRSLEACAERRRALEEDPENDPECGFVRLGEKELLYLGELESGTEGDWIEFRPETAPGEGPEHRWENLGEGGQAIEIDKVLEEMAEARQADDRRRDSAAESSARDGPGRPACAVNRDRTDVTNSVRDGPLPAAEPEQVLPVGAGDGEGDQVKHGGGGRAPISPRSGERSPEPASSAAEKPSRRARKRYKKRQPKPPFTPIVPTDDEAAYETRKAQAVADTQAERRANAAAEAERRERRTSE